MKSFEPTTFRKLAGAHRAAIAIIPVLAMFLATPSSKAGVILCTDQANTVCQITSLNIDGTDYDVTFGKTPDLSLAAHTQDALNAIVGALNAAGDSLDWAGDGILADDQQLLTDACNGACGQEYLLVA